MMLNVASWWQESDGLSTPEWVRTRDASLKGSRNLVQFASADVSKEKTYGCRP